MSGSALLHAACWHKHPATKAELLTAWEGEKSFKIWGGPYCSIRDKAVLLADYGRIVLTYGNDNFLVIED